MADLSIVPAGQPYASIPGQIQGASLLASEVVTGATECTRICDATPGCVFAILDAGPSGEPNPTCLLTTAYINGPGYINLAQPLTTTFVYAPNGLAEIAGLALLNSATLIVEIGVATPEACAAACLGNPACVFAVYDPGFHTCDLYSGEPDSSLNGAAAAALITFYKASFSS